MKGRIRIGWISNTLGALVFLVAVLALTRFVPRLSNAKTLPTKTVVENTKTQATGVSNEWQTKEIKSAITIRLPPDMKSIRPIGDADWYREAYANPSLSLTIVYGYLIRPRHDRPDTFASCNTPRLLLDNPEFHESDVQIDGRKAKLGIDRSHAKQFINATVCFPQAGAYEPLRLIAYCKNDRALEMAQAIFTSVRFRKEENK